MSNISQTRWLLYLLSFLIQAENTPRWPFQPSKGLDLQWWTPHRYLSPDDDFLAYFPLFWLKSMYFCSFRPFSVGKKNCTAKICFHG